MKIYKYKLSVRDEQIISLPEGYKILYIAVQYDDPCIWALVDPTNQPVDVKFITYGTGYEIDETEFLDYIGSYQLMNGRFVYHVFKVDR